MKFKGTIVLLALATSLSLFAYFYEVKGGKAREEKEENAKKIVKVEEDKIDGIDIVRPGVETLKLVKNDSGSWDITSPISARADDGAVGSLTWQISDMSYNQVVDENPGDLAAFGLVTPEVRVDFEADGKKTSVLFGADSPIGYDAYVKVADKNRVMSVSRSVKQAMDTQVNDIRDKRVVVFDPEDLVALEIASGEAELKFEKKDGDWAFTSPEKVDASDDEISGLVDQLTTLEADEFTPEVVAKTLDLGDPDVTITMVLGKDERARKKLSLWKIEDAEKSNKLYAHPEGDPWYYKSTSSILSDAGKDFDEFRERKVVHFDRFDLTKIEVRPDPKGEPIVLTKDDKGDWNVIEPESAKGKALPTRMYDFIDSLENLRGLEFVDNPPPASETGLGDTPAVILYGKSGGEDGESSKGEEKESGRLYVGGESPGGMVYVKGARPQVFLVMKGEVDIPKDAEAFKTKPEPPDPDLMTPEFE